MFPCCSARKSESKWPARKTIEKRAKLAKKPGKLKCVHLPCSNTVENVHLNEWRGAVVGDRIFRFCSDECWSQWLLTVDHQTLRSPFFKFMGSPMTPAIEPYTNTLAMPLLNI